MGGGGRDSELGAMCRLSGVDESGTRFLTTWKCWTRSGQTSLRWEVRRFFLDVGISETKHSPLSKQISTRWPELQALQQCFFGEEQHIGRSLRSLLAIAATTEAMLADAEQEYWVDTPLLLLALGHFGEAKRRSQDRHRAHALGRIMLESCASADACRALAWRAQVNSHLERCSEMRADGRCSCVRELLDPSSELIADNKSHQAMLFEAIVLFFTHRSCPAIAAACADLVKLAGAIIDSGVLEWGDFEWHRSSIATVRTESKCRRTDPHVKAFCLQVSISEGFATTVGQAARGMSSASSSQAVQ